MELYILLSCSRILHIVMGIYTIFIHHKYSWGDKFKMMNWRIKHDAHMVQNINVHGFGLKTGEKEII